MASGSAEHPEAAARADRRAEFRQHQVADLLRLRMAPAAKCLYAVSDRTVAGGCSVHERMEAIALIHDGCCHVARWYATWSAASCRPVMARATCIAWSFGPDLPGQLECGDQRGHGGGHRP